MEGGLGWGWEYAMGGGGGVHPSLTLAHCLPRQSHKSPTRYHGTYVPRTKREAEASKRASENQQSKQAKQSKAKAAKTVEPGRHEIPMQSKNMKRIPKQSPTRNSLWTSGKHTSGIQMEADGGGGREGKAGLL